MRKFVLLGLLSLTLVGRNRWDADGLAWWENVEYLASDELQGRNVGTRGFDLAANFVATQFERSGLKTAGDYSYFQKVLFTNTTLISTNVRVQRDGKWLRVPVPAEAEIHYSTQSTPGLQARVVFAGYGLQIPELDYDDFKGLPLKGAIVAYLMGGPTNIDNSLKAHYGSSEMRWQAMKAAGAIGMIAIPNPNAMATSWVRQTEGWGAPQIALLDPEMNHFQGLQFSATWNPAGADDLLSGSSHTFSQVLSAANRQQDLPHFLIEGSLRADILVKTQVVSSKNVVAIHPGEDSSLKDEFVVVSAHLDHLGTNCPPARPCHDEIFHGAMDNASGVSSMIEIAKKLKQVTTKRSIVFLALTAEEKGELGSAYFAHYPELHGRMVADLNMDMFLPIVPFKRLEVQGLDESTLGIDVKVIANRAGIQVQGDKDPNSSSFRRSDQYSFVKAGVPALAFKFGYRRGEPEERVFERWYATRYHGIRDDLKQPVDLKAAAEFDTFLKSLVVRVADADTAPHWHDDSFFKRFSENNIQMSGF